MLECSDGGDVLLGAACADASNGKNKHKRLTKRIRYASVKKKNRNAAKAVLDDSARATQRRLRHYSSIAALLDKYQRIMGHWQGPISLER